MSEASNPIRGDLRALVRISLPLMLFLFCEAFTSFCERIFLSYHSIDAIHASLNASYLATIFQSPCVAIGAMAQVFVGFYQGSNEYKRIGPCVWQLIWFSFLSFLITFPLSFLASSWYFKDTIIQKAGMEYFTMLALGNFLFPLSTALSSFYLGRGKTLLVTTLMVASYALHLALSWLLIFGVEGVIPALGAKGAALAKCMSLGVLCTIFWGCFLTRKNREIYGTDFWQFSPRVLWHYMRPGMVRAFGFLSSKICWVAISYVIIKKGGKYLDALTIGGTVITFLVFIAMGLYKAILTIASNLIGAEKSSEIWNLCRSFIVYTIGVAITLTIPLIFFPDTLIYFFDSSSKETFKQTFRDINHWIWLYMLALTLQTSFCAVLVALQDLKFQLYCYLFLWPISFVPIYFGLSLGEWQADKLWAIMALENIAFMLFFFIRLRQKKLEKQFLAT
ncbi:MAG: MATE family efflux transporter [Rhabdochlamydiaceae bacterium]